MTGFVEGRAYRVAVDGACLMVGVAIGPRCDRATTTPLYVRKGTVLVCAGPIVVDGPRATVGWLVTVEQGDEARRILANLGHHGSLPFREAELVAIGTRIEDSVEPII